MPESQPFARCPVCGSTELTPAKKTVLKRVFPGCTYVGYICECGQRFSIRLDPPKPDSDSGVSPSTKKKIATN